MKDEDVARYLGENPAFFERYADLLAEVYVAHPHGGRAIPLSERQILALREKVKALEVKLAELIQFGEENDAISEKAHRLALALLAAPDFPALVGALYYNLREDFSVPHTAMRVWRGEGDYAEFTPASVDLHEFATGLSEPFCGPNTGSEAVSWFGEAAAHVRSCALMPIRHGGETFGLLALGSEDGERFYPEMGTLYLRRIGEMVSAGLARVLVL